MKKKIYVVLNRILSLEMINRVKLSEKVILIESQFLCVFYIYS